VIRRADGAGPSGCDPGRRRSGTLALLRRSLLPVALLVGLGGPVVAQVVPPTSPPALVEIEARFEAVRAEYDRDLSLFQQAFFRSERALEEVRAAIQARDSGREDQARASYHARAVEAMDAEAVVRRSASRLAQASRELIAALEAREFEILEALGSGILSPALRASLDAEWRTVRQRTLEVDRISGGIEEDVDLRPVLQLTADPRDTPADLRGKAGVLEDQADAYEAIIARLDELIGALERRIQQEQAFQDQVTDLQRFDPDVLIPGGRLGRLPAGLREDAPAGFEGGLAQLPPVEQVELFRGVRAQAIEYRNLALDQARVFRNLADGGVR